MQIENIIPGTKVRLNGRILVIGAVARALMGRPAHHTSEGVMADILLAGATTVTP